MDKVPPQSRDLIERLRRDNPLRIPRPGDDRAMWMEFGRQQLIAELEASIKAQDDRNILEQKLTEQ